MARLIDADSLIEDLELLAKHQESFRQSVILGVVHTIKARSTIDAVKVVRCEDCKYRFKNNGHSRDGCPIIDANIWTDGDDFCSHGERKDGDGNG